MNLASVIALLGALLGGLLAAALQLAQGRNRLANTILAVFTLVFAVHLLAWVPVFNHMALSRSLFGVLLNGVFLLGPLLYFYVRAMTEPQFRLRVGAALHALSLLLLLVVEWYIGTGNDDLQHLLQQAAARGWPPAPGAVIALLCYISFITYLLLSLVRLRMHARRVAETFSWLEGVSLRWLWLLISISLALASIGLALSVARLFIDMTAWPRGTYSMLMVVTLFHLIAFMAIRQPAIFHAAVSDPHSAAAAVIEPAAAGPRYQTSSLDADAIAAHWQRLLQLMAEHKPHLHNELRAADLAALLGVPIHQLSQIISRSGGLHFFEFINRYRVEEAKILLGRPDCRAHKMTTIAFDAGFNSQSAFYKQFKKHTGRTPQEYRADLAAGLVLAAPFPS
jgi:AraC-like DNA-binding protein